MLFFWFGFFGLYALVGAYDILTNKGKTSKLIDDELKKPDVLLTKYNGVHKSNLLLCHDNKEPASILKMTQNILSNTGYVYDFNASSTIDLCMKNNAVARYNISYLSPKPTRMSTFMFNIRFGLKNLIFLCDACNIIVPQSHCTTKVYRCLETAHSAIMTHITSYFRFFNSKDLESLTVGTTVANNSSITIETANLSSRRIYMFGDFNTDETQKTVFVCKKMSTDKKLLLSAIYQDRGNVTAQIGINILLKFLSAFCYVNF